MNHLHPFLKLAPCEYHDENHTYTSTLTGKLWPGVTSIIGNLSKPFLIPWAAKEVVEALAGKQAEIKSASPDEYLAILEEAKGAHRRKADTAADHGTLAHDWCELYVKAKLGVLDDIPNYPKLSPEAQSAVTAFLSWEAATMSIGSPPSS